MYRFKIALLSLGLFFSINASSLASPAHITSFADIVEPLMPSVVNIYTVKYNPTVSQNTALPEMIPDKLHQFFDQFNMPFTFEGGYNSPTATALGSGFIVDKNGYIITNNHVVSGSDEIYVKLSNGTEFIAKIVGTDPKTDIALLKIDSKQDLPEVIFANSKKTRLGDVVIAIGNPLGFGGTVTTGIISSKGRDLGVNQDELVDDFIQIDAAINAGNSGGPLFNIEGQVIGMNTAIPDAGGGTNIGIGFAIPSDTVQDIMEQLKVKGKVSRGRLNIAIQEITVELAEALSLDKDYGVLVVDVREGGAGDKAGLKRGDLITEFNGEPVLNSRKLQLFVADSHIDDEVKLTVIRNNKPIDLIAKIVEFEQSEEDDILEKDVPTTQKSGVMFSNLSPGLISKFGLSEKDKGIMVVKFDSEDINLNLRTGDLVMAINQEYIDDIKQFDSIYNKIKNEKKQTVVLLVKRRDTKMFVAFPIT